MKRIIPYATQWIDKEDIGAVTKALKSDYLTQGPRVKEFEKRVASLAGAKYAVAVNSGTSALHIACLAAGIGRNDEVIVPAITFVASANCVLYCGGIPKFCDVREDTINIDVNDLKKKITKKTKAVISVDFAGCPADLAEIKKIAGKKGLIVIEDASHALGAKYKGDYVGYGKYSDMTIFSFHAVKNITTAEGGMVVTNNERLYKKLLLFRSHGITRDADLLQNKNDGAWYYEMHVLGYNYRLTDIQCALGISQLKKLGNFNARRREIVTEYDKAFQKLPGIKVLHRSKDVESANHLYVLRFDSKYFKCPRKDIFEFYRKAGIGVNVHYIPVYYHPFYKKLGYRRGLCPVSEKYYEEAITLPLYPKMTKTQITRVIAVTKEVLAKFSKNN